VFVTADQLTAIADLLRGAVGLAVGGFIKKQGTRCSPSTPDVSALPARGRDGALNEHCLLFVGSIQATGFNQQLRCGKRR
jgi:hypothetical protein